MKLTSIVESTNQYPKFEFNSCPHGGFYAADENTYDGASDGNNYIGHGATKLKALENLCDELAHQRLYPGHVLAAAVDEFKQIMSQGEMDQVRQDGNQDERGRVAEAATSEYEFIDMARRLHGAINTFHGEVIKATHQGPYNIQEELPAELGDALLVASKQLDNFTSKFN